MEDSALGTVVALNIGGKVALYTHARTHTHTRMHTHLNTNTHTHTHTRTHTHIHGGECIGRHCGLKISEAW